MSAWIVDKGHIDVLVSAMIEYGIITPDKAQEVGQDLWRENHRSVNARYGERTPTPRYEPTLTTEPLEPAALLKATGCYDYQSCEHKGWESSEAKRLTVALEAAIEQRHPNLFARVANRYRSSPADATMPAYYNHKIYNVAPWGFTKLEQAYTSAYTDIEESRS